MLRRLALPLCQGSGAKLCNVHGDSIRNVYAANARQSYECNRYYDKLDLNGFIQLRCQWSQFVKFQQLMFFSEAFGENHYSLAEAHQYLRTSPVGPLDCSMGGRAINSEARAKFQSDKVSVRKS
ncbi:hypothetical protein TSAR_015489 [Trichomalopsis sarcophagae]|uniref:Uncharacterized protein n=1 Tax=Trichomalopsis sarcophagae TaxID=543379 RepID=A0A232EQG3_9HYME|nr:hypothetical protein TSAR_015489 [Trichomalopsis sarcophagae]